MIADNYMTFFLLLTCISLFFPMVLFHTGYDISCQTYVNHFIVYGFFCSLAALLNLFLDNSLTPQSSLSIDVKFQCDSNTFFSNRFSSFIKTEKADVEIYVPAAKEKNLQNTNTHNHVNSSTGIPLLSAEDTLFILLLGSIQSFHSMFFLRSFVKLLARIKPHDLKPFSQ